MQWPGTMHQIITPGKARVLQPVYLNDPCNQNSHLYLQPTSSPHIFLTQIFSLFCTLHHGEVLDLPSKRLR